MAQFKVFLILNCIVTSFEAFDNLSAQYKYTTITGKWVDTPARLTMTPICSLVYKLLLDEKLSASLGFIVSSPVREIV
ncbi:hypothetical protein F5Y19DRAFT_112525 [Xylariaceae sp. FL1651]|nr:hypothetical protein F5Y19DRAFT_112525 [Xylariaceae sp. FL1651]